MADPQECPYCAHAGLTCIQEVQAFHYGTEAVTLSAAVRVQRCESCGFSFTGEDAEIARHEAVCRHLGVLTPAEIRSLRSQLALSRAEFAERASIELTSLILWEAGAQIQSRLLDRSMRRLGAA